MLAQYDYGFKVIIAGSSGVGKSSLLLRYVDNTYQTNLLSTIGVDFKFKTLPLGDKKIRLQIWDTAGSQAFRSIVSAYYRGSDAVILVYNLADKSTWNDLTEFWMEEVNKYKEPHCKIMLIGNKSDQGTEEVSEELIRDFMTKENIDLYYKTSAKTGNQVAKAFEMLANQLMKNEKNQQKVDSMNMDKLKHAPVEKKKCCG